MDSTNTNQVTVQGGSDPPVRAVGEYAGSSRHQSYRETSSLTQGEEWNFATGQRADGLRDGVSNSPIVDPFARRPSIPRSPTRSVGGTRSGSRDEGEIKRKRDLNESFVDDRRDKKRKDGSEAAQALAMLKALSELVNKLPNYIEQNTKKEIKDLNSKITRQLKILSRSSIMTWLEEQNATANKEWESDLGKPVSGEMGQTELMLDGPNTDKVITKDKKQMVDCSTQTVDEGNFHSLSSGLTYKQLEEIKNRVWDSSVFTNTEIKEGNPLNTKDTCPKILLLGPDETGLDKGLHKAFVQYFPDLQDIVEDVGTQEDLFEKMRAIKKETTGDEFIAMHETNFCKVEELRKIIETVFHGSNSIVVLYVKNTKTLGEPNKREKKSFAFIVQKENQDYKEILKEVKDTLIKKNAENDIESFRSTKDGALLITTKKDPTIAEKICGALNGLNKLGNSTKFKQLGIETNKESFFIRGIDADTDKNQIMRDLEKVFVGLTQENTSLGELRPLSNDTQTITLTCSDEKIIKELSARTRIKIGWVYCRLEPRLKGKIDRPVVTKILLIGCHSPSRNSFSYDACSCCEVYV
ncbi:hypothetical protein HUJ05_002597 [Dendroctonus ponderosae]|nr:hypothetical protein HUJ05_002597 [Dendroctonus ponderosae]